VGRVRPLNLFRASHFALRGRGFQSISLALGIIGASSKFRLLFGSAYTFRQARRTLAATGKLLQRPLDDAIFKRVKTDYCRRPAGLSGQRTNKKDRGFQVAVDRDRTLETCEWRGGSSVYFLYQCASTVFARSVVVLRLARSRRCTFLEQFFASAASAYSKMRLAISTSEDDRAALLRFHHRRVMRMSSGASYRN